MISHKTTGGNHPIEGQHSAQIAELITCIAAWGGDPAEYDLPAMDAALDAEGYANDAWAFNKLMRSNHIPSRTSAPCPQFCTDQHGHPFDDGFLRTHHGDNLAPSLDARESITVNIEQHEERDGSDDGTVRRQDPVIFFAFDGGELSSVDARRVAEALMTAADRLDRVITADKEA